MASEVTVPVRAILSLPRDDDGLYIQPDELTPEFAVVMEKNRERMASKWDYADEWTGNTRTVDKAKDYNCRGCNQADGDVCLAVYDDSDVDAEDEPPLVVDLDYGSCGKYEIICAGDPELRANRLPASVANYGVRKDGSPGHVFACHECPFAKATKWPDSRNRPLWCGKGASTVQDGACCTINGAPTVERNTPAISSEEKDRSLKMRRSKPAKMLRKVVPVQITTLGEDEVEVRMSTSIRARDGHILLAPGAQLDNYRRNPVFLWNHDVDLPPIGRSEDIRIEEDELVSRVRFPPLGISTRADEIRGLAKTGFINAVSVGFDPLDGEVIDAAKPRAGSRFTSWELLECSFCCVPVDTNALVTQRAEKAADWKCGVSRELPIEDSDAWDGAAAETSVFDWAGGDDFDPSRARKGFLAYNAAKPKERSSYKLPIAHVVDGRLKVPKGAIRAAASRLPQADIPDTINKSAREALDHYEETAGMAEKDKSGSDRAIVIKQRRALERAPKLPAFKRGLYDVAALASLLSQVGYATDCAEWEAEIEEDESKVPAMLGEALKQLGDALIAMTAEEVGELLAMHDGDEEDVADEESGDRAFVLAGKTPRTRAWRRAVVMTRAGKAISATNAERIEQAQGHLTRAAKHHQVIGEDHTAVAEHMGDLGDAHKRAVKAHGELGEALEAVTNEPAKATEHVARAVKLHGAVAGHQQDVTEATENAMERNQDLGDAHSSLGRSVRAAQRSVRAVVEGSTPGDDDDSKDVQTSDGTAQSDGSASGRSHRRRQKDLQELSAIGLSYN